MASPTASPAATATTSSTNNETTLPIGQPKPDAQATSSEASTAAAPPTQKREKKPKQPKAPAAPAKALTPALIDLRVGHILKAERHPNADSLYVSTIAMGDAADAPNTSAYTPDGAADAVTVRIVCSGLNGLVPLEDMQGRLVVCVCNLKPVTMRGIKSAAMVLAASPRVAEGEEDTHAGPVELVDVPAGAKAGDRVWFEGFEYGDGEPEAQLNPKKKVWEACQVGFGTTEEGVVGFERGKVEGIGGEGTALLKTEAGICKVKSLKGATVR